MAYKSVLIHAALCLCVLAVQSPGDEQGHEQAEQVRLLTQQARAQADQLRLLAEQARARLADEASVDALRVELAAQALTSQATQQRSSGVADEARRRLDEARKSIMERSQQSRLGHSEDSLYERGTGALDRGQWDKAVEYFTAAGKLNGRRAEGALYWKAYAQNKLGQRDQALLTVQTLLNTYPNGRWANDAKALELEVRQAAGQPVSPQGEQDDELTLLALTGLQNSDAEQAVPILEKFLKSSRSPKLKERALFVLAQSRSPKARDLLAQVARGGGNPDLQLRAIRYLGMHGKENAGLLAEVYGASNDVDAKRAVLQGFMMAGQRDRILAVAKSESNPDLRKEAVRLLGMMGGKNELWDLYGSESNSDVREQILGSLARSGNAEKLIEIARGDKEEKLRRSAIRSLGIMPSSKVGDALASLYSANQSVDIRKDIIRSLAMQRNAHALVELARKETDTELKKEIVRHLSTMKSKEATDYMLELLNK